ncbi:MAG TPA: DNA repair protein RadA [Chloroflexota bacterium]|nr:DNA repair protein RadA [Chloroflexota bacterium]
MARARTEYICQQCGAKSARYMGRCADCGEWNTLVEQVDQAATPTRRASVARLVTPRPLREIEDSEEDRVLLQMPEVNRVLGGGLVRGSMVLVGGDPGIGKSTLLMQIASDVALRAGPVLYISGEESARQVAMRARRLGLDAAELLFLAETDLDAMIAAAGHSSPVLIVVDSIQSTASSDLDSAPGAVGQLRECTQRLTRLAKESGTAVVLIGHVTKEGAIAGPKVLEHMVDAVLYLEGERFQSYRLLRSTKNRFGATNEVGVFEMRGEGMIEVINPSAAFLSERDASSPGTAVVPTMEGSRPVLVEVQALVAKSGLAVPRRTGNGIDFNRLLVVMAVLSRRLRLPVHDQDVYVNITGGMRIDEPAADLGVALAVVSSLRDTPLDPGLVVAGEVGLSGELRSVGQIERRLREAANLGFTRAVVSRGSLRARPSGLPIETVPVTTLREALRAALVSTSKDQ